jgi:formamidopyrimidine-DNA glycosylase
MPEVAEVRLIADNLDRFLVGKYLTQFRVKDPVVLAKWINRNCQGLEQLNKKLDQIKTGLLVKSVKTRGKFCYIECDTDIFIGISFGMSGNIRPDPTPEFLTIFKSKGKPISKEEYLKHCHIAIEFFSQPSDPSDPSDLSLPSLPSLPSVRKLASLASLASLLPGQSERNDRNERTVEKIYYHDIRRFGRFDIFYSRNELEAKLTKLGHDPLSQDSLDNTTILTLFRTHNQQNICKVLMEQELFAGVGNFIKSETLYEAKISPYAIVASIPDQALINLYEAIKKIAKDDYESGGCSLYTFSGLQGDQSDFKDTLKVYGHEGQLDSHGFPIKRIPEKLSPDKRSTFWVPEIQTVGHTSNLLSGFDPNKNTSNFLSDIKTSNEALTNTSDVLSEPDKNIACTKLNPKITLKKIFLNPPKVLPIISIKKKN